MNRQEQGLGVGVVLLGLIVIVLAIMLAVRHNQSLAGFSQAAETRRYWSQLSAGSLVLGRADAKHTVVVFTDYQCAVCRDYDLMLHDLLTSYPADVKVVVRQNPLRAIHPFADLAANAAVCGDAQAGFAAVHRSLFARQDLLAAQAWGALGHEAGIADTVSFVQCARERRSENVVAEDVRLANALRLRRSPSVILDGELLGSTPNLGQIALRGGFGPGPGTKPGKRGAFPPPQDR